MQDSNGFVICDALDMSTLSNPVVGKPYVLFTVAMLVSSGPVSSPRVALVE